ncbi:NepR family anti-sigma factor [Hyphomicrobium denitrificans]|nr:NepR family anti-sigma factor [Hyphomicrobium denitrificans]
MGASSASKLGELTPSQTQLPAELQGQIGQRLREAYNELISEPVPDRFINLLQQLKDREDKSPDDHQEQGQGGKT